MKKNKLRLSPLCPFIHSEEILFAIFTFSNFLRLAFPTLVASRLTDSVTSSEQLEETVAMKAHLFI